MNPTIPTPMPLLWHTYYDRKSHGWFKPTLAGAGNSTDTHQHTKRVYDLVPHELSSTIESIRLSFTRNRNTSNKEHDLPTFGQLCSWTRSHQYAVRRVSHLNIRRTLDVFLSCLRQKFRRIYPVPRDESSKS